MTTDQIRAAAERIVREIEVHGITGTSDAIAVARAYLADHPADDGKFARQHAEPASIFQELPPLYGRIDKPFHRPECRCAKCLAWMAENRKSSEPAEAGGRPLRGEWRHSHGVISCGTLRIAIEDFDTDPCEQFKTEVLDWMCQRLNERHPAPSDAADLRAEVERLRKELRTMTDNRNHLIGQRDTARQECRDHFRQVQELCAKHNDAVLANENLTARAEAAEAKLAEVERERDDIIAEWEVALTIRSFEKTPLAALKSITEVVCSERDTLAAKLAAAEAEREALRGALTNVKEFHEFCLTRAPNMTPCYAAEHQDQIDLIDAALAPKGAADGQ
jgi:hypothetical protein